VKYDQRRAEVDAVAGRLAAARRRRDLLDPGSFDDLDAYRVINELADELRERRGLRESHLDVVIRTRTGR
jgi:hypothetical protein